ncbi:MAG: hypothetical protein BGO51_08075 [Rhodospirillales bacterium 69-11]|nr:MAG: hypothetical protein BGO51_08075 [Rhodospirillales bacterium 69-11]
MNAPNENGCYAAEVIEELARLGCSYAAVKLCQCEDGLYRYALSLQYSYGGFGGPIFASSEGYATQREAVDAAIEELMVTFPKGLNHPESMRNELRQLKAQIEQRFDQPTLF